MDTQTNKIYRYLLEHQRNNTQKFDMLLAYTENARTQNQKKYIKSQSVQKEIDAPIASAKPSS